MACHEDWFCGIGQIEHVQSAVGGHKCVAPVDLQVAHVVLRRRLVGSGTSQVRGIADIHDFQVGIDDHVREIAGHLNLADPAVNQPRVRAYRVRRIGDIDCLQADTRDGHKGVMTHHLNVIRETVQIVRADERRVSGAGEIEYLQAI